MTAARSPVICIVDPRGIHTGSCEAERYEIGRFTVSTIYFVGQNFIVRWQLVRKGKMGL
jgi:hypothetical protein